MTHAALCCSADHLQPTSCALQHAVLVTAGNACRRHLNVRGKSANLPAITAKDWDDIKFGVDVGVDYYALSFVRTAEVIYELKRFLSQQGALCTACLGLTQP